MKEELSDLLLAIKGIPYEDEYRTGRIANALSMIKEILGEKSWVGFYLRCGGKWVLGPFQGSPACEKIAFGKGVVGSCGEGKRTLSVEDVNRFPGYICCDSIAKSEICVPLLINGCVQAIFDIDLPYYHRFDEEEEKLFEEISQEFIRLGII